MSEPLPVPAELRVKLDAAPKVVGLGGTGYPEADVKPMSEAEAAVLARRHTRQAEDDAKRVGPTYSGFRHGPGRAGTRVSGMTYEEVAEWFRTGVWP